MKILQVCGRYYPNIGGVEEHVRNISERLAKNHEVTVATTDPSGKLDKEEILNSVSIIRFKSWAPNEAYHFSYSLNRYLRMNSGNFDIVHAHSYHAFPALYAANAKKTNRLVFTPHYFAKGATPFRSLLHIPYKLIGRRIVQRADSIISISNFEKNLLLKNFRIPSDKITVIPHGVSLKEFQGLKRNRTNWRTILYVGRLVEYKGIDYIIKTLPYLDQDIRLEIIGSGPHYPNLQTLVYRLGLTDRVFFLGGGLSRTEIEQKYADADLFILLSKYEGFAICVAEALAAGTICILANISALTEWIDNKNCFGIDYPINIASLVDLINKNMGKRAESVKLSDWDDAVARIVDVYCSSTV